MNDLPPTPESAINPGPTKELREVFRGMLLPVAPQSEELSLAAIDEAFSMTGVSVADRAVQLRQYLDIWREAGVIDAALMALIRAALSQAHPQFGSLLADMYVRGFRELRDQYYFSHDDAVLLLGHTLLIAELASSRMTASQIAKMLSARDSRIHFFWRPVKRIMDLLQIRQTLSEDQVRVLQQDDRDSEEMDFADADLPASTEIVAARSARLRFPGDLSQLLNDLIRSDANGNIFWPYLQILHYQCVLAEFYDHALTHLYEFNPRGRAPEPVYALYSGFTTAGNPFLNNAKAVDRATFDWAESKEQLQATALVHILAGLEDMSFAARKELASWLRRWLLRVIRLRRPKAISLPATITTAQSRRLLTSVARLETNTRGIIEQRIVDAGSILMYGNENWRRRGTADSVNATNLSRRKLGDCDFQDANDHLVFAFEAHAGRLTKVYAQDHRASLTKALRLRRDEEWANISDPELWSVTVTFVAHEFESGVKEPSLIVDGLEITFRYMTFAEFVAEVQVANPFGMIRQMLTAHVIGPLNKLQTPDSVRRKFLEIVG